MSVVNVIRSADGLTILTDGAGYNADGVVQAVTSKLLIWPHMSAVIGVRGPLGLLPKLFAMFYPCGSFDEALDRHSEHPGEPPGAGHGV